MPKEKPLDDGFRSASSKSIFTRNAIIMGVVLVCAPFVVMMAVMIPFFLSAISTPPGQKPPVPGLGFAAGMAFFYLSILLGPFILAGIMQGQINSHRVPTAKLKGKTVAYATLWQRGWALLLNDLIVGAASFALAGVLAALAYALGGGGLAVGLSFGLTLLFSLFAGLLYIVYLDGSTGQSPGRKWMGIRVLTLELKPCGFWYSLLRNIVTFVDAFGQYVMGVMFIGFTRHQQRLGDLAAGTVVLKVKAEEES